MYKRTIVAIAGDLFIGEYDPGEFNHVENVAPVVSAHSKVEAARSKTHDQMAKSENGVFVPATGLQNSYH